MTSKAITIEETRAASNTNALGSLLIWLVPLAYPFCFPVIIQSLDWVRAGEMIGGVLLFVAAMTWALVGPLAAWLTLDFLDRNGIDRQQYRMVVYGALLTAASTPLYNVLGGALARFNHAPLRLPAWYFINVLVAAAAFLPASEPQIAPVAFRRIHGYSAMFIVLFAMAHVSNHVLAIVSLDTHLAVLHVLRLAYRERLIEIGLVAAVVTQAFTGLTMVWKSRLRRTTTFRNLQTVSGLFLAAFFLSHLHGVFSARSRTVDTTFSWATNAPAGLLAKGGPVGLLPYYTLAVVMLFVHLACQARRNLARVMSETAARRISYSLMAIGGIAAFVIALAACGIHLRS